MGVVPVVIPGVNPPKQEFWFPHATNVTGGFIPDLVGSGILPNLAFAGVLVGAVVFGGLRHRAMRWVLAILAVGALLQALIYLGSTVVIDPNMPTWLREALRPAMIWGLVAVVADAVAGLLVIAATVIARRTKSTAVAHSQRLWCRRLVDGQLS